MDSAGSNRSSNSRRGGRARVNTTNFPVEQGIICSLKDSFGFIHCADRPLEIFFHYSEVSNCHPDDLQVDTEVEFRVGPSEKDPSKLAAYQVITLPTGTVVWETEEEPEKIYQGLVERNIYNDSRGGNGKSGMEGSIVVLDGEANALLPEDSKEGASNTNDKKKSSRLVRYREQDVETSPNNKLGRLFRGDLVQFRILTDRRTKQNYARHITLLQTEKERSRILKEKKMLENASEEEGVVISLNNGFGFIRSNKRREHVYFHYSHLIVPEDDDGKHFELKKGQEMKFLVVTEMKNGEPKCAARQLECIPKGSVVFHKVVAQGVKGRLTLCPLPPSAGNPGYADDKNGSISLLEPLVDKSEGVDSSTSVTEVALEFSDAPGGVYTFKQRGSEVNGLWIQEGDTLLFDIVKELADGSYRASPTLHTIENGGTIKPPSDDAKNEDSVATVRLVALSLIGRAEGTMHTLKASGGYGFIHFAERPIDVHFHTYNLIPDDIQVDLRKNLGVEGMPVNLEVGVGTQFDICAHGTVSSGANGRGRASRKPHERENVKAHRVLLLPSSAVMMEKAIATGVKGVVKSADTKQLYAGFLDLDDELEPMSIEEKHPLVAQMIDSFIENSNKPTGEKAIVYRDVLSMNDDDAVVEMIQKKGDGILRYSHIPVAGISARLGRLCIRRVEESKEENEEEIETETKPTLPKNAKTKQVKPNKSVRFDKSSLAKGGDQEIPPAAGDIVTCDIVQSRRTGKFMVHNLKVVERKELDADAEELASTEISGLGIVKEVVPKSNFGFISVLDEDATKHEVLFFHLHVGRRKDWRSCPSPFRKGDEVKFDIGVEKSGKRVAANVEVLPKGTIPSKPAKDACRGLVLMVPSHTSLSDTPLRKQHSSASSEKSGSRWGNVKDDPQKYHNDVHAEGCILLLEDKTGMFKKKRRTRKRGMSVGSTDDDTRSVDTLDSVDEDTKSVESSDDLEQKNGELSILSRLAYKNGAIAIHGEGSSYSMDSSSNPRRGDLVSFVKAKRGSSVRDIRVDTRQAATMLRGRLENIEILIPGEKAGKAKFIAATEKEEQYDVELTEVVGCDVALLKDKETVEGILHEGKIYGICRTKDITLSSKLGTSHKERPKLNLSVKKNRGGKIIAQSMMAKGPDGTSGFAPGWTTRKSQYAVQ